MEVEGEHREDRQSYFMTLVLNTYNCGLLLERWLEDVSEVIKVDHFLLWNYDLFKHRQWKYSALILMSYYKFVGDFLFIRKNNLHILKKMVSVLK